jgi:hypothetical protein
MTIPESYLERGHKALHKIKEAPYMFQPKERLVEWYGHTKQTSNDNTS